MDADERICQKVLCNTQLVRVCACRDALHRKRVHQLAESYAGVLLHYSVEQPHPERHGGRAIWARVQSLPVESSYSDGGSPGDMTDRRWRQFRQQVGKLPLRPATGVVIVHRAHPAVRRWIESELGDGKRRLPQFLRRLIADCWMPDAAPRLNAQIPPTAATRRCVIL